MRICALEELKELMAYFPDSYINNNLELILIPKTNTYFKIEDCECHLDVKEKLLTWCSRTIAKGQPYANPIKNKYRFLYRCIKCFIPRLCDILIFTLLFFLT